MFRVGCAAFFKMFAQAHSFFGSGEGTRSRIRVHTAVIMDNRDAPKPCVAWESEGTRTLKLDQTAEERWGIAMSNDGQPALCLLDNVLVCRPPTPGLTRQDL